MVRAVHDDSISDALVEGLAGGSVVGVMGGHAPDVAAWARVALGVIADHPAARTVASIGIPTWFYGHEPPNGFAGKIAKFFSNALREDILLVLVTSGVVYLPGAAGTVQEVFQATTPGYCSENGGDPLRAPRRRARAGAAARVPAAQCARGRPRDGGAGAPRRRPARPRCGAQGTSAPGVGRYSTAAMTSTTRSRKASTCGSA